MINIIYRISDKGYKKNKPSYINNENCLKNFCTVFDGYNISVIADNIGDETYDMIQKYVVPSRIHKVSIGHGAGTFNIALDMALGRLNDNDIIYFVENDYLHRPNADKILLEGLDLKNSFVSLYDHPDKYISPERGGNMYAFGGAESTRVYLTQSCHWKITNSTTMTFAARVKVLRKNEAILRKWTCSTHPHDMHMFIELINCQETLVTPIPGYATHGETEWLCPLIDWSQI